MEKNLDSTYAKAYIEQVVANAVQLNSYEWIKLLILLNEFDWFFGGTFLYWYTDHVDLGVLTPVQHSQYGISVL